MVSRERTSPPALSTSGEGASLWYLWHTILQGVHLCFHSPQ